MKYTAALAILLTGCATGQMTQAEQDSSDRTIRALQVLQASPWGTKPAAPAVDLSPRPAPTAVLINQYTQGYTRYCIYRRAEGNFSMPIQLASVCPASL